MTVEAIVGRCVHMTQRHFFLFLHVAAVADGIALSHQLFGKRAGVRVMANIAVASTNGAVQKGLPNHFALVVAIEAKILTRAAELEASVRLMWIVAADTVTILDRCVLVQLFELGFFFLVADETLVRTGACDRVRIGCTVRVVAGDADAAGNRAVNELGIFAQVAVALASRARFHAGTHAAVVLPTLADSVAVLAVVEVVLPVVHHPVG